MNEQYVFEQSGWDMDAYEEYRFCIPFHPHYIKSILIIDDNDNVYDLIVLNKEIQIIFEEHFPLITGESKWMIKMQRETNSIFDNYNFESLTHTRIKIFYSKEDAI